jgi:hypothetical protein
MATVLPSQVRLTRFTVRRPRHLRIIRTGKERRLRSERFLIEEVALGAQPYLPSSATYREAGVAAID